MDASGKRGPSPRLSARSASHADDPAAAGVRLDADIPTHIVFAMVALTSVALYNVVELTVLIFTTFKKRSGLYFVAFCIATYGILPYSIAYLAAGVQPDLSPAALYGCAATVLVGFVCTITGQSLVLYSRLHLIDRDPRHLRTVLTMIIVNAIVFQGAITVLLFGANSHANPHLFYKPFKIMEKVQVTVFFLQEVSISSLYIYATVKFFRDSALHAASARAHLLWHLIIVNILIILIDVTILGLEFADLYKLQTAYKAMAYSVKLKLEFRILNELVRITREHGSTSTDGSAGSAGTDSVRWTYGDSVWGATQPFSAANTGSTGDVEGRGIGRGGGKRRRWYGMGGLLGCGWRNTKEKDEGGRYPAFHTPESGASQDQGPQRRSGTIGWANTSTGRRSPDIAATTEMREPGGGDTR